MIENVKANKSMEQEYVVGCKEKRVKEDTHELSLHTSTKHDANDLQTMHMCSLARNGNAI